MSETPPLDDRRRPRAVVRRVLAFGTALVVALVGFTMVVTPAHAVSCVDVNIWSTYTDLYVSAELGDPLFPGMLRARATEPHEWEKFTLCQDAMHYFTLQSKANGLFVSVEHGYEGHYQDMLRARTKPENVGNWEKFLREDWGDVEAYKSDRTLYVSAEFGYAGNEYGMLRARNTYRGEWESFDHYFAS